MDGVRRVIDAPDARALRTRLDEIFAPIAPTVHLAARGESFPDDAALHPRTTAGLDVVAWEHRGYGDTAVASGYASKRRGRPRKAAAPGVPLVSLSQAIDVVPYRGSTVRLRGKLRTESLARGRLWLRVERGDTTTFSDDMSDRPVVSERWTMAEITGPVDLSATRIVFGIQQLSGIGSAWYDDLELAVQLQNGAWQRIEIKDPGFEEAESLASWKPEFGAESATAIPGWKVTLDREGVASGGSSLRVERVAERSDKELFDDAPRPVETVDIDLGGGLRARVPISLYSQDGHTIGDDPSAIQRFQVGSQQSKAGSQHGSPPSYDVAAGIADVIVAWNVLQHFWPYWDTASKDWTAQLDVSLGEALRDQTVDAHVATLWRLSAAAPDGHAVVACPGRTHWTVPPFAVDLVEKQIVIVASADPALSPGDIVVSATGRPADVQVEEKKSLRSGSAQLLTVLALRRFGEGLLGTRLPLRIRRGSAELGVNVPRNGKVVAEPTGPAIRRLNDGVYYVDLSRASMAAINATIDQLAAAPGVIFDVRSHPNGNHMILSHLLTRPDDAKGWLGFPRVIRPDHGPTSIPSWDTDEWEIAVRQPHIAGRVAFLIGPTTASYGESIIGFVEHYKLGELVGSTTAGANGNYAQIAEPSGCSSNFTGLRVTKLDGSRMHLVGFQPTIPVSRTIAGVAAGRDEVLERALAYVRTGVR